jgi:tetratricopeptide (TPR) repeat protein
MSESDNKSKRKLSTNPKAPPKPKATAKPKATPKPKDKSNVVKFPGPKSTNKKSPSELAEEKLIEALEFEGKKQVALVKEALEIDPDCSNAYLILASLEKDVTESVKLYRQAVKAAQKALPPKWEQQFKGVFWLAHETRPVMRAMAALAMALQMDDALDEALTLYRKLLAFNPNDNQGIRYQLAGCLFEAKCDSELEKLLAENKDDTSAALVYTRALYLFRKHGANDLSTRVLMAAYKSNKHVPLYLSDVIEMPETPPTFIGFGDDNEAIAYVMDNNFMWIETPGSMKWMADSLEPALRKDFDNKAMVDDALEELRIIGV